MVHDFTAQIVQATKALCFLSLYMELLNGKLKLLLFQSLHYDQSVNNQNIGLEFALPNKCLPNLPLGINFFMIKQNAEYEAFQDLVLRSTVSFLSFLIKG